MKDYHTIRYDSRNENGREQLTLEIDLTLWEKVWHVVKDRTLAIPKKRVEIYEVKGTYWVNKKTGEVPNSEIQFECFEAKTWVRSQTSYNDDWKKTFGVK